MVLVLSRRRPYRLSKAAPVYLVSRISSANLVMRSLLSVLGAIAAAAMSLLLASIFCLTMMEGAVKVKSAQGIGGRVEKDGNLETCKVLEWVVERDTVLFPRGAVIYEATHGVRHPAVAQ